ncbi:MAG: hypothetical protein H7Y20_07950 [Bryobacteraceae bacterium]|nr:hypothetical protein [Bryobacteraceae bacterium]
MMLTGSPGAREFRLTGTAPEHWYLLNMRPGATFDVEVDDEGITEVSSDRGGIVALKFAERAGQSVYVHEPRTGQTPIIDLRSPPSKD